MTTDPERASFIAAIVDDPDDDLPRLIMADWLDERGEHDRAEFVRVQCELAGHMPSCARAAEEQPDSTDWTCPCHALRRRERELWSGTAGIEFAQFNVKFGMDTRLEDYRRGFLHTIRASASDWMRPAAINSAEWQGGTIGQSILAANPVEVVAFTDCGRTITIEKRQTDSEYKWVLGVNPGMAGGLSKCPYKSRGELIDAMPAEMRRFGIGWESVTTSTFRSEIEEVERRIIASLGIPRAFLHSGPA